jgi:hypothetical protein
VSADRQPSVPEVPEWRRDDVNVIVNDSTRWIPLIILGLIMLAISLVLLRWTRKLSWR